MWAYITLTSVGNLNKPVYYGMAYGKSRPALRNMAAVRINGKPISAVGSSEMMRSNNTIPSDSALKAPAQS
jgi:hypothetical protein